MKYFVFAIAIVVVAWLGWILSDAWRYWNPSEADERLVSASSSGNIEAMIQALNAGADLDAVAFETWTPLTAAIENNQLEAVVFLVEAGADINKNSPGDITPLFWAERKGKDDIAEYLVGQGAKSNR